MNNKGYCKKLITILDKEILHYKNNIEGICKDISQAQNLKLEINEFLKNDSSASNDERHNLERNMQIVKYKQQIEQLNKIMISNQKLIADYNKGNYLVFSDGDAFYTYHLNVYTKKQEQHWNIYIRPQQATEEKVALLCALNHRSVEDNKRILEHGGNYESALGDVPTLIKYNVSILGYDAFVSNERRVPLYDELFNINTKSEFIEKSLKIAGEAVLYGLATFIFGIGVFAFVVAFVALILAGINSIRQKNIIKKIIKFEEYITKQDNIMEKFYEYNKLTNDLHNKQRAEDITKVMNDLNQSYSELTNELSIKTDIH